MYTRFCSAYRSPKCRRKILADFFLTEKISINQFDEIQFIDQGANFEAIFCDKFNTELDIDFWQEQMGQASESAFTTLNIETLCCGQQTSLNDLRYVWPAGFSKFVIEIENADRDILPDEIEELAKILDTPIRKIWAHY